MRVCGGGVGGGGGGGGGRSAICISMETPFISQDPKKETWSGNETGRTAGKLHTHTRTHTHTLSLTHNTHTHTHTHTHTQKMTVAETGY